MTDAGAPRTEPVRRTPRWMLVALLASLAVNLIVVGSVAGAMWRFRKAPPWASAVTPNLLGYASTLPAERRKRLWEDTTEERRHIRPFRREVRTAREETIKTLIAEPFEKQQLHCRPGAPSRGREPGAPGGAGPLRQDCRQPDAGGAARLSELARAPPPPRPQSPRRARSAPGPRAQAIDRVGRPARRRRRLGQCVEFGTLRPDCRLRGGKARDRHAEGRAGHVVEADLRGRRRSRPDRRHARRRCRP